MLESQQEKSNKRILVIANNDVGLYQFRRELLHSLLQRGNTIIISLPYGNLIQPLVDQGCQFIETPIDRRGINPKTDSKLFFQYRKLLKQIKPDLVITYTIKPNIYGGFACRLAQIPYAVNITGLGTAFQRDGILKKLVIFLYKRALKAAKVVFFENCENMETLISLRICKREQCKLMNGAGVNLDHFSYQAYPRHENVHFLFVGRIMREKGIDELFTVMKRLHDEGNACVLDVVGRYEEDYESIIKKYQQDGWLNYFGYQEDVRPFIKNADCFVLPSWHEGMANTNLECAASGRAIITSNIHGCKEAVRENESGFLCEPQNTDSLYHAMKQFLALSREQKESFGKCGRKHMENVFDKRKVVQETIRGLDL